MSQTRYGFKVLDTWMRANNGGNHTYKLGEWTPEVDAIICRSGYHLTEDPLIWPGKRVFLAEGRGIGEQMEDKFVCTSIRLVEEVTPENCIDERIAARLAGTGDWRPDLSYADLSYADLNYADLSYANLSDADLSNANLSNAKLRSANLSNAKLRSANLSNADLRNANLWNADLRSANTTGAIGL